MVTINVGKFEVRLKGREIWFPYKEFHILKSLALAKGYVVSREELRVGRSQKGVAVDSRTVDQHVARIRRKLGKYGNTIIKTIPNMGYKTTYVSLIG